MGVVGLGVMGSNLALNMERNGFPVAGYDLDSSKMRAFTSGPAKGKNVVGVDSPEALMQTLEKPRRILIMVPAGAPVDSAMDHLKPHLEKGDILMDGGNSYFLDTDRRNKDLEAQGFLYIGAGVSGGEEGALWGPAIMPRRTARSLGSRRSHPSGHGSARRRRRALRRVHGAARRGPLRQDGP